MTPFIHLNIHTEYSVVDGLISVKPLISKMVEMNMPAVAITDRNNLYATIKLYHAAQSAGIKPIIGTELLLEPLDPDNDPTNFVVLCQNNEGYKNLSSLITKAHLDGQDTGIPVIKWEWLKEYAQGLIILSGADQGEIGQLLITGNLPDACKRCQEWKELFDDRFYLELQRIGKPGEDDLIEDTLDLAVEFAIPVVATNAARFLETETFEPHEARVCIYDGRTLDDPRRSKKYTPQQYIRSSEEMIELFKDIPEAIENTGLIAQRCNIEFTSGIYHLPDFPVPEGVTIDDWLRQSSREGLEKRLAILLDSESEDFPEKRKVYDERLERELGVIIQMGFPGYFLIVADFIQWAKDNAIPVGPGRGSGAGSLVAYSLAITDLDPLEYDLLFERFLNPERVSMPDFDIDFCMDRRDEVIDYVARKYGRDHVSQIITHGTMAAKAVVRDCGRTLGFPYGFVDQISKLIPFELKMTLDKALKQEEALRERYEQEEDVQTLIDLALKLEGTVRNVGKHAGGVVIAPSAMSDFVPLYCEPDSPSVVCQFDMNDVESIGLVKFDFLGLRTLTIIDWAVRDANIQRAALDEPPIDITQLPLDDEKTYQLFAEANTMAVFQFESRGMRDMLKSAKPDRFEDIIALVSLYRPGPMELIPDFVDRKFGKKFEYLHPFLEPIQRSTYGIMVYQEQVMQAAQDCAGFTLGGADLLRRAMGKKKVDEMAKQRTLFVEGANEKGIDENKANEIFDYMEKFAGYGFNKSHAAAYSLVAYQTAWLKTYYPAAFMAAVLSSDMDNTDKVVGLIDECRHMGVEVISPDVNVCESKFTIQDEKTIRYGLGAIKGVGESAIDDLSAERAENGKFTDLFDLCRRMDTRKVNRRVLEALIKTGALDQLGPGRSSMMASLGSALKMADQHSKNRSAGQNDMFGLMADTEDTSSSSSFTLVKDWTEEEVLSAEKATLGLYLSGHPIDRYENELKKLISYRLSDLKPGTRRVAGLIIGIRVINARRGRMAIVTLDDKTGRVDIVVYSEVLEEYGEYLLKDRIIVVEGECREDDYSDGFSIIAEQISDIEKSRANYARQLVININQTTLSNGELNGLIPELQEILLPYKNGACRIMLDFQQKEAATRMCLGKDWRVQLPDKLLDQLKERLGDGQVNVEY
ncbi:MAG: DNA polymerase III subunit alpha [Gammaproteobacteria bacterium]